MNWIDVNDKLPEYVCRVGNKQFCPVLICTKDSMVMECIYCNGIWKIFNNIEVENITHWMYLPKPPEPPEQHRENNVKVIS